MLRISCGILVQNVSIDAILTHIPAPLVALFKHILFQVLGRHIGLIFALNAPIIVVFSPHEEKKD
jgi:hypothetical protein